MDIGNLGEFLRARRMITTPRQVGLVNSGSRRTPGLRREEVALLAGVSTVYYIRLEQGRERRPSGQVIAALARALHLDADATDYLYKLVYPGIRQPTPVGWPKQVNPDLLRLMNSWPHTPAMVISRWMDVLAMNPLGTALHSDLGHIDNVLRLVFLDPAAREFYRDWEHLTSCWVAHLRAAAGADLDDPDLTELVGELSFKSAGFRRLWSRHDISRITRQVKYFHLRHREVGDLTLSCDVFNLTSAPGQQLVTVYAEPGSPSEHALTRLGSLADMVS